MKKFFLSTILIILSIMTFLTIYLTINGYETKNLNNIISKKINQNQPDLDIKFSSIKIKIDIKKTAIFLTTNNPDIIYQNISLPLSKLNIYIDFPSLLKSKIKIHIINFDLEKINIINFKKLITRIKPSNFKSFILNNIREGEIEGIFNLEFEEELKVKSYNIDAKVENLDLNFSDKIKIKDTSFNIVVDNKEIFINSIKSNFKNIPITTGEIRINRVDDFKISGIIDSKFNKINEKKLQSLIGNFFKSNIFENKINFSGNFSSKFNATFTNSLELKNYDLSLEVNKIDSEIKLVNNIIIPIFKNDIEVINLDKTQLKLDINNKNNNKFIIEGEYKFNNIDTYEKFKIINTNDKSKSNYIINLDNKNAVEIEIINYQKSVDVSSNISSVLSVVNNKININKFDYREGKNLISIKGLKLDKNKNFKELKSAIIKTYDNKKENNNFSLTFSDKILVKGTKFDATKIINLINSKSKKNYFKKINKEIEVDFKSVFIKNNDQLNNLNLYGNLTGGKLTKMLGKGEFFDNKFLDISLKKDPDSSKKILEIFSDVADPLLTEYKFFKGVKNGNLLFESKYDKLNSSANLKMENFKVQDAPGFAKLLSLADFGGVADLLSGEGIRFKVLDIKFTNNKDIMRIEELYAVGPSISILIDGYIDNKSGLTSLRGTMVPAKDLNKLISKIPVLGKILVPTEIGEGMFGVSFKIKGMPGKLKTTVNPIKTLTPRFITKALEKSKKTK